MTTPIGFFYPIPIHPVSNKLSAIAREVLGRLYWHRNAKTGQCNPRHTTLARALNCSLSTIQRAIRQLRESGIIRAMKGKRGNQYEIRPTEEWGKGMDQSCPVAREEAPVKRQDDFILNEEETLFLNKSVSGVAASFPGTSGGGGAPAAQKKTAPTPPSGSPRELPQKPLPEKRTEEAPEIRERAERLVMELLPQHPQPGNPGGAVKDIAKVLGEGATEEQIRSSHSQWRKMWAVYREGRFIPQLWRWIRDNDWRYPPEEKQIKSNTDPNREREAANQARMEKARIEAEARRPEEEERERKRKRRQEIETCEDIVNGRIIWPVPSPEMVEKTRRRLAELRAEVAA